jgi:branched-chain amino acid transport system substrate-binding protein
VSRIQRGCAAVLLLTALGACAGPGAAGGAAPGQPAQGGVPARGLGPAPTTPVAGAPTAPGQPLVLAVVAAVSGEAEDIGREQVLGAQLAMEVVNEQGGIGGQRIEVLTRDSGSAGPGGRLAMEDLLAGTQVLGVVGPTLSQQAGEAAGLADRAGLPLLGAGLTDANVPQLGTFIARLGPPTAALAPAALDAALLADPEATDIAFLQGDGEWRALTETLELQAAADARGLDTVAVERFTRDPATQAAAASGVLTAEPDLVMLVGPTAESVTLIQQLRERGYEGGLIGWGNLATAEAATRCGDACTGLVVAQGYDPDLGNTANQTLRARYLARQGVLPSQAAAQAYAAVQVYAESLRAIDQGGGLQGRAVAELRTALNAAVLAGRFETPVGAVSFTQDGELREPLVRVGTLQAGEAGLGWQGLAQE